MALIKCYECEKEISDQAPACPHCGAPDETGRLLHEKEARKQMMKELSARQREIDTGEARELLREKESEKERRWKERQEKYPLWTLYTSLRGRISRKTLWLRFIVPISALNLVAVIIDISLEETYGYGLRWGWFLCFLISFWPSIVGLVKRLHDRDMTGKHIAALFGFFGVMGWLVDWISYDADWINGDFLWIPVLGWTAYFCSLGIPIFFLRGTDWPNSYGPDPLQVGK
jgi:uncharacterized membrane protein YhaH (DUF805 family)